MTIIFMILGYTININAYVLWGSGIRDPKNVSLFRNPSATSYSATTYYTQWNSAKITFGVPNSYSSDIIMGVNNTDNGTYGVTKQSGIGKFSIVYYKAFINTDITRQRETVVHEVGHALGLDHTQTANNSKSVMRELGFNLKPYPLSDDINGIKARYF